MIIWIGVAVLFALLEIFMPFFGLIFASGAALVAAAVSAKFENLNLEIGIFSIVTLLGLFILRPKVIAKIHKSGQRFPSRTEALIGKKGLVVEEIDSIAGTGRIEVDGQDWAAKSEAKIQAGMSVVVLGIDGIILLVRKNN